MIKYSLGAVTRVASVFAVTMVAALALTSCQPDDTQGAVVGNRTTTTGGYTAPSSNRVATTNNCGPNANLPAGIDSRVCTKFPGTVTRLYPSGMFVTPSRNIACDITADQYDIYSENIRCKIFNTSFTRPANPSPNPYVGWQGNVAVLKNGYAKMGIVAGDASNAESAVNSRGSITTLNYGQIATAGRGWCLSQSLGLTCWDDRTGHGFFLSQAQYSVW